MNKYDWILILMLMMVACRPSKEDGVTVSGDIKGLEAGELIYYAPVQDMKNSQSVVAEAGKFRINIPVSAGQGDWYRVWIGASPLADNMIMVYVDSGEVKLSGTDGGFKGVQYAGKPFADEYNAYLSFIGNSAEKAMQWLREHPSSRLTTAILWQFQQNGALPKDTVIAILERSASTARENEPSKRMKEWMTTTADVMTGKTAPDFSMADTTGKQVALADFRGKYVLLDFWASWCGPCRAENPNVVKAFQAYKHKGFTVLGVSLDREGDREKWLAAIHKDQLEWTHLSDLKYWDNAAAKQYHVQSVPSNFLIGPDGVIIARDLRGEGLHIKLAELLP